MCTCGSEGGVCDVRVCMNTYRHLLVGRGCHSNTQNGTNANNNCLNRKVRKLQDKKFNLVNLINKRYLQQGIAKVQPTREVAIEEAITVVVAVTPKPVATDYTQHKTTKQQTG